MKFTLKLLIIQISVLLEVPLITQGTPEPTEHQVLVLLILLNSKYP